MEEEKGKCWFWIKLDCLEGVFGFSSPLAKKLFFASLNLRPSIMRATALSTSLGVDLKYY